jgi:crotonobetainyl-CoA:carnitine CoA-transferase CaiB-like acyl-CoA transferase
MSKENTEPSPRDAPLAGVHVVEIAQNVAGPFCGRLLADLGARVTKVEPQAGDAMRHIRLTIQPEHLFALYNHGKRSLMLDLGQPADRSSLDELLDTADVVLVAVKPGDLERFGLDYEAVRARNPEVVHAVITGQGTQGPAGTDGGYDLLAQARSGTGFLTARSRGGRPLLVPIPYNDFGAGYAATIAILGALMHRSRAGRGQAVETSLLAAGLAFASGQVARFEDEQPLWAELTQATSTGDFPTRQANFETTLVGHSARLDLVYRTYEAADGLVTVAALSPVLGRRFLALFDDTPDVSTASDDVERIAAIEAAFRKRPVDEWLATLQEAGIPSCRFLDPAAVSEDEQVCANDYFLDVDDPTLGRYRMAAPPFRFGLSRLPEPGPVPMPTKDGADQ